MHAASILCPPRAIVSGTTHLVQSLQLTRSIRADGNLLWVHVLHVPLQGYAILDIRRNEATTTWYYAPELTKAGQ